MPVWLEKTYVYEEMFNQLVEMTDELGRQTLYEIDPRTGNRLSVRRVVGADDRDSGTCRSPESAQSAAAAESEKPEPPRSAIVDSEPEPEVHAVEEFQPQEVCDPDGDRRSYRQWVEPKPEPKLHELKPKMPEPKPAA